MQSQLSVKTGHSSWNTNMADSKDEFDSSDDEKMEEKVEINLPPNFNTRSNQQ